MRTGGHDNPPQRGGLLAARGLIAMECWSFDADEAGLDLRYGRQLEACRRVFARCGHRVERTAADPGTMGREAHAFVRFASGGGDVCMACRSCGRLEEAEIAAFRRDAPAAEEPLPVEEVAAPGTSTIEGLAAFLHITPSRTAKAVLMAGEGDDGRSKLVLALIRGDLEVSEAKLARAAGMRALRPAREEEIRAAGAVRGYASPVGLSRVEVIADLSIRDSANMVGGANREGWHFRNLNFGRGLAAAAVADVAAAGTREP